MNVTRLLLGRTQEITENGTGFWSFGEQERKNLKKHNIEVMTFGLPPADIVINFLEHDFAHLENQLKTKSFSPDLALVLTCGYGFLPLGFEKAPFKTFLLSTEWFTTAHHLRYQAERVDGIVGVLETSVPYLHKITGKAGLYTSLPSMGDRFDAIHPLTEAKKIYDVAYVGHCSPLIHPGKAHFLSRLALLPESYKVFIGETVGSGSLFEKTNLINNQAKIGVNFSHPLVKAVGTRVLHTLLSGTFLLADHLVDEGEFLTDKVDCAFFEDDSLEERIAYYLNHENEREKIASEGLRLAQDGAFDFTRNLVKIIQKFQKSSEDKPGTKRAFTNLSRERQYNALGVELLFSEFMTKEEGYEKAFHFFKKALEHSPNNPEFCNNLGVAYGLSFLCRAGLTQEVREKHKTDALSWFRKASALSPGDVVAGFNEACLDRMTKNWPSFLELYTKLSKTLVAMDSRDEQNIPYLGPVLPAFIDFYGKRKWHELFYQGFQDGKPTHSFYDGMKQYFLYHLNSWMGEFLVERNEFESAIQHFEKACTSLPDSYQAFEILGRCLATCGRLREACAAFKKCLEINPLDVAGAGYLCDVLMNRGETREVEELAKKYELICKRIPFCQYALSYFSNLRQKLASSAAKKA